MEVKSLDICSLPPHTNHYKTRNPRQKFLDKFCFLCYWRSAGKSVVAIGAEKSNHGVVFRLCGQSSHLEEAMPHFEKAVTVMVSALKVSDHDRVVMSATIAANAIARSEEKICRYYERLRKILPEPFTSPEDGSLLQSSDPGRCLAKGV